MSNGVIKLVGHGLLPLCSQPSLLSDIGCPCGGRSAATARTYSCVRAHESGPRRPKMSKAQEKSAKQKRKRKDKEVRVRMRCVECGE
eukprot:33103-Eustigmatos_ZCMA.PRE.1